MKSKSFLALAIVRLAIIIWHYYTLTSYMPSQLFRKCLAPYLGANYWDWRSESYSNNILETISLFKGIIE